MKRVTLFTMKNCRHCQNAKKYLDQLGIHYRLCDVQTPKGQKEFAKSGYRAVPVLRVGEQWLNGFSVAEFTRLYQRG